MKTSNKLLLGLIIALFLIATVFVLMGKRSISISKYGEGDKETTFMSFDESKAQVRSDLYFPVNILLPRLPLR